MSRASILCVALVLSGCLGTSDGCAECRGAETPIDVAQATHITGSGCDEMLFRVDADEELLKQALPPGFSFESGPLPLELFLRLFDCTFEIDNATFDGSVFVLSCRVSAPEGLATGRDHYVLELGTTSPLVSEVLATKGLQVLRLTQATVPNATHGETVIEAPGVSYRAYGPVMDEPAEEHEQSLRLHHQGQDGWTGLDLALHRDVPRTDTVVYEFSAVGGRAAELAGSGPRSEVASEVALGGPASTELEIHILEG